MDRIGEHLDGRRLHREMDKRQACEDLGKILSLLVEESMVDPMLAQEVVLSLPPGKYRGIATENFDPKVKPQRGGNDGNG